MHPTSIVRGIIRLHPDRDPEDLDLARDEGELL